ncbi:MAG: hypothetical protein QM783_03625 [Phycisphaerales bacterium]
MKLLDAVEHGRGLPDEHAAVPTEHAAGDVRLGAGEVGLFDVAGDLEGAGRPLVGHRCAAFDVAEPGRGVGGLDAECDEPARVLLDQAEADFHALAEELLRLDHVVGGKDGEDRLRVELVQHRRGEADGVDGVARGRLAEDAVVGEFGKGGADGLAVSLAGADIAALGGDQPVHAMGGDLQEAHRLRVGIPDKRKKLLGLSVAAHRPQTCSRPTRHDHRVPHGPRYRRSGGVSQRGPGVLPLSGCGWR